MTVASGQRLTGAASATLGFSSSDDEDRVAVLHGVCYQNTSGGALETFSPGVASMLLVHRGYASSTASSMETGTPSPGTYNVGFCVDNLSGVEPLDQNWAVNGWVQVTN